MSGSAPASRAFWHEFRTAGRERRVGEPHTLQSFCALEGSDIVAVPLINQRGDRPEDVMGVLFVKARNVEIVNGKLTLREHVLRALVSSS